MTAELPDFTIDLVPKYTAYTVLKDFLPMSTVGFLVAMITTPIYRRIALLTGVMGRPETDIKLHKKPTPYMGGGWRSIPAGLQR